MRYHKQAGELIAAGCEANTRSNEYDNFVLTNRDYLKNQLSLCEMAVQKILKYSNNYLYKVTASGDGKRVCLQPTQGKQKSEVSIEDIAAIHVKDCQINKCIEAVKKLENESIRNWRKLSQENQKSRKTVINELIETNNFCKYFIQIVTGAGLSCIARAIRAFTNNSKIS